MPAEFNADERAYFATKKALDHLSIAVAALSERSAHSVDATAVSTQLSCAISLIHEPIHKLHIFAFDNENDPDPVATATLNKAAIAAQAKR